jgi:protein-tyrosine phosphatase
VLLVLEALRQDAKVLVHCTGGLNRSGLVMALIVAMLEEISGEEAIELLRERHDPWVLCNPTFELYVRNVAGEEPA